MNYAKKNMNVKLFISFGLMFFLACGTPEQKETKPSVEPVNIKGRIQIDEIKYSGPPKESWIVTGIRDTVTNDLAKVREVEAISIDDQNKALKMIAERRKAGEKNLDPSKESAKILAADYLCVGNLQNTGKVLRLNIRLLKAPDFSAEQTATLDGTLDEIFTLQDKVVESLLANLDAKMSPEERLVIEMFTPKNKKAYELYTQGLQIEDTNPKKALDLFLQALKLEPDYLEAMNWIGIQYNALSQYEKAFEYHNRRKKLLEDKKLNNHKEYAKTLNNIGLVYKSQDKYAEALDYYFKAQKIGEDLGLIKTELYATSLNNIGGVYDSQGKYAEALDYYFQSKKIREDLGLGKTIGYATSLNNIGFAYELQGKHTEALDYYFKAQKIGEDLGLRKTELYASTLNNIGAVYYGKGEVCKSVEWIQKAVTIKEQIGVPSKRNNLNIAQEECNITKPANVEQEKKKAIDWLKSESIGDDLIKDITKDIDYAIQEKKKIWFAFGKGTLKSGKIIEIRWKNNHFKKWS
jgi:tetratricopeptide (TPR) repeat protein